MTVQLTVGETVCLWWVGYVCLLSANFKKFVKVEFYKFLATSRDFTRYLTETVNFTGINENKILIRDTSYIMFIKISQIGTYIIRVSVNK